MLILNTIQDVNQIKSLENSWKVTQDRDGVQYYQRNSMISFEQDTLNKLSGVHTILLKFKAGSNSFDIYL